MEGPVVEMWWAKESKECLRARLVRMARRKFDAGTASELSTLLEDASGSGA